MRCWHGYAGRYDCFDFSYCDDQVMSVAAAVEDNNTRVLFERVLSSGSLPAEKSRSASQCRHYC